VVADGVLHVFTTHGRTTTAIHAAATELCGLPPRAVRVHVLPELPVTANGKPDRAALERQARLTADAERSGRAAEAASGGVRPPTAEEIRDHYALVLGRPDAAVHSSFVELGGDSLSYVELATRLGDRLGHLPPGWHTRSIAELAAGATPARRGTSLDTTVLLRALAIVAIVGTHANLFTLVGGAHVLLAVAGFNFARFQVADAPRTTRLRHGLVGVAQVVVPSSVFIGAAGLLTGGYTWPTALFLNGALGSDDWTVQWQFWFLEALVWISLGLVAVLAVPAVDRLERRAPLLLPWLVLLGAVALRYAWTGVEAGPTERYTPGIVLWCFVLGWVAARSRSVPQRLAVTAAAALATAGFFDDPTRELLVVAGVALLVWLPAVRVPRRLGRALTVLAAASLFLYLTHWQVYPHLEVDHPLLATLASFAVGVGYWWLSRPAVRRLGPALRTLASARP
jgi:hypothetical protein